MVFCSLNIGQIRKKVKFSGDPRCPEPPLFSAPSTDHDFVTLVKIWANHPTPTIFAMVFLSVSDVPAQMVPERESLMSC